MQLDNLLLFDTNTAVTSTSVVSANIIDLAVARDLGPGERIQGIIIANAAFFATGTTATINIQVQVSTLSTGTYSTILESGALTSASLGATTATTRVWDFSLTRNNQNLQGQRFMRLNYSYPASGGTAFASGNFYSFLLDGADMHQYYPGGVTITN